VGKVVHPCKVNESIRIATLSVMSKLKFRRILRSCIGLGRTWCMMLMSPLMVGQYLTKILWWVGQDNKNARIARIGFG
jgi:hypothetical protein